MSTTIWIVLGPSDHGVVVLAREICRQLQSDFSGPRNTESVCIPAESIDELLCSAALTDALQAGKNHQGPTVHVHFTDQLFGRDCSTAAAAYLKLADLVTDLHGGELSVTLHDLPMPTDELHRYRRRAHAYSQVVAATNGAIIVSSAHEAALLAVFACDAAATVISLPLDPIPQSQESRIPATSGDVTMLGFLNSGSGHDDVLEALSWLPQGIGLTALGRIADHHEYLAGDLVRRARELDRRFAVTGWIEAGDLPSVLRRPGIPVVGPRHISASASIGSWLAAGRRPLVPDVPYTRELADRIPNSLTRYEPTLDGLVWALRRAYQNPASTWLPADVALGPSSAEVAARYQGALRGRSVTGLR